MEQLLSFLPALACPLGMGLLMWLMMRPGRHQHTEDAGGQPVHEIAALREEIAALRARQHPGESPARATVPGAVSGRL